MSSSLQVLSAPAVSGQPAVTESDVMGKTVDMSKPLPCVLYEANASREVIAVTDNARELLGLDGETILKSHTFWGGCLFENDVPGVEEQLLALESLDSVSFVHRMLNSAGLPIWVSHSIVKDRGSVEPGFRGCLVPILDDRRVFALDQKLVDHFVHKLGNHFQLLNLIAGSLLKDLPPSRDRDLLLETLDKAAELTRTFAEANQITSWVPEIQLGEVLKGVLESHRSAFSNKGVSLSDGVDEHLCHAMLPGDPFLLEAALSHILTEVLDSTCYGEGLSVTSSVVQTSMNSGVAKLRFLVDHELVSRTSAELVNRNEQNSKFSPDGMGIPLAARFVEMHGGLLIAEKSARGVAVVDVSLPIQMLSWGCCS